MSAEAKEDLELAHVLFVDVVGYSKTLVDEQREILRELNAIVRQTEQFRKADTQQKLICLPTGDGMALAFFTTPEAPVRCVIEIARALQSHPEIQLRMGVHTGPVNTVADVNERANVAGAGINMAQRVMDCGDAGHILLSQRAAEDLGQSREWSPLLHDLGECEVKHGVRVHLFNFHGDDFGNAATPTRVKQGRRSDKKRSWLMPIAIGAAVLLVLGVVSYQLTRSKKRDSSTTTAPEKSVAVLPFENLSEDRSNAYFTAGIQDEILTALSRLHDLKVISRTSTAKYATHPENLRAIASELGVAAILEGSVQKAGEAVHINVQLISGGNDEHLWGESYDRDLKNIFAVEREVAETVAGALKATLLPQEARQLAQVPTKNAEAYDLYLRAKFVDDQYWTSQADSEKPAIELYQQAIALDPDFALAYAHLAWAEIRMYNLGEDRSPERIADAQRHAEKALALQPDLIEGHLVLGRIFARKREPAKALEQYEPLLARLPNDADLLIAVASAKSQLGDRGAVLKATLRAVELDPHNSDYLRRLGNSYVANRRYAEAENTYLRAQALAPDDWFIRASRAQSLKCAGKLAEARQVIQTGDDTRLSTSALSIKYSSLQEIETLAHDYTAAIAAGGKIPQLGNRIPTAALPIGDIRKNTDLGFDAHYLGDETGAQRAFSAAKELLEPQRGARDADPDFYGDLALIEAGLRHREAAIEAGKKAVALSRPDGIYPSGIYEITLAQVYACFGLADEALPIIEKILALPFAGELITPALLRLDPIWDPIRNDCRFQRLVTSAEQNLR